MQAVLVCSTLCVYVLLARKQRRCDDDKDINLNFCILSQCFVRCFQQLYPPRNPIFESCILVTAFLGLMVDQHHPSWIAFGFESKSLPSLWSASRNLRVCKALQIVCLGGLCISPKQSQPRNLWNGHGVPCQTLPSAKFHCFRALDVLKFERTPLEFV